MARYAIKVPRCNAEDYNTPALANDDEDDDEYVFIVLMYIIVSLLRVLEYLLLAKQFYLFFFKQDEIKPAEVFRKHSLAFCNKALLFLILLPYLTFGVSVPLLGIYQETKLIEKVAPCSKKHYYQIYFAYCAMNFLRYCSAFTVRVLMIVTTISLRRI